MLVSSQEFELLTHKIKKQTWKCHESIGIRNLMKYLWPLVNVHYLRLVVLTQSREHKYYKMMIKWCKNVKLILLWRH